MTEGLKSLNEVYEGVAGIKNHTKNVVGHKPFLHQKYPYFFDLIKWFRKKPDPHISLNK